MVEIWKSILGYEGRYEVSNMGNIKSLKRYAPMKRNCTIKCLKERLLVPHVGNLKSDYYRVGLSKDNITTTRFLHRLVAQAFIPNPENKPHVNHKDGDKRNNAADNLEWVTQKENQRHAVINGLLVPNYGMKKTICLNDSLGFHSAAAAGRHYGIDSRAVGKVCNGVWESAKGMKFKYID